MKHTREHYVGKNGRYPGGRFHATEEAVDIFDKNGSHRVALRKGGDGMWHDRSEEHGCPDRHSLSPRGKEFSPGDKEYGKNQSSGQSLAQAVADQIDGQ